MKHRRWDRLGHKISCLIRRRRHWPPLLRNRANRSPSRRQAHILQACQIHLQALKWKLLSLCLRVKARSWPSQSQATRGAATTLTSTLPRETRVTRATTKKKKRRKTRNLDTNSPWPQSRPPKEGIQASERGNSLHNNKRRASSWMA